MVKVKPLKSSWETKMKLKRDRKMVMTHEKELKDEKKKEKEVRTDLNRTVGSDMALC